jgi:hypothetical protein
MEGNAYATWELSWNINTNEIKCGYGGLYAVVTTKVVIDEKRIIMIHVKEVSFLHLKR